MAEEKKDLTGIIVYAKKLQESGEAPPAPEGSLMEETPIEKINDFESLDDYAKANPMPDPQEAPPTPAEPSPPVSSKEPEESQIESTPPEASPAEPPPAEPFTSSEPTPEQSFQPDSESPPPSSEDPFAVSTDPSSSPGTDFDFTSTPESAPPPEATSPSNTPADSQPTDFSSDFASSNPSSESNSPDFLSQHDSQPPHPETAPTLPAQDSAPQTSNSTPPLQSASEASPPPSPQKPIPPPPPPAKPLEKVKQFVENHPSVQPKAVPASFPFSLLIEGHLSPAEREKLLDLLSRENMGIREIDLEPQFASGRILIPRISEYAGVLLVQALRTLSARMRLGPAEKIFKRQSAPPEPSSSESLPNYEAQEQAQTFSSQNAHPAESIPITQESSLPELSSYTVIDTLSATATIKAQWVASSSSLEYQSLLEALQRELKYKAFHRGAQALISFRIQLTPISTSSDYRLLALGTAIKPLGGEKKPEPKTTDEDPHPQEHTDTP